MLCICLNPISPRERAVWPGSRDSCACACAASRRASLQARSPHSPTRPLSLSRCLLSRSPAQHAASVHFASFSASSQRCNTGTPRGTVGERGASTSTSDRHRLREEQRGEGKRRQRGRVHRADSPGETQSSSTEEVARTACSLSDNTRERHKPAGDRRSGPQTRPACQGHGEED